ncbi:MAG: response regulator [Geobacteraceae bacterium]|nr:MAG: response regulator [Geobacteraceae bacterium]
MLIVCPNCKTRLGFDEQKVCAVEIKLRCGKCRALFKVVRKSLKPSPLPPPMPPAHGSGTGIKVVVAHESAAFCSAVKKVLAPEPFDVFSCNDGKEALAAIERLLPDTVLLDVSLPSMYGFEVCEAVRKNPAMSSVKLILIASIYDKTRYKRSPSSLYGADDYIEKHHIPDSLAATIYRLVAGQEPADSHVGDNPPIEEEGEAVPPRLSARETADQESTRREFQRDEEPVILSSVTPPAPELTAAHVKARRLARIIVSDIALYNQATVEEGIRNGNFYRLLADDVHEGRALYERRVPEEIRSCTSYLKEAFEELISKKKRELSLQRT